MVKHSCNNFSGFSKQCYPSVASDCLGPLFPALVMTLPYLDQNDTHLNVKMGFIEWQRPVEMKAQGPGRTISTIQTGFKCSNSQMPYLHHLSQHQKQSAGIKAPEYSIGALQVKERPALQPREVPKRAVKNQKYLDKRDDSKSLNVAVDTRSLLVPQGPVKGCYPSLTS